MGGRLWPDPRQPRRVRCRPKSQKEEVAVLWAEFTNCSSTVAATATLSRPVAVAGGQRQLPRQHEGSSRVAVAGGSGRVAVAGWQRQHGRLEHSATPATADMAHLS